MQSAPLPANEEQRLAELTSYNVLDSAPDPVLDELTRLASQICDTPIALISLIDNERQWFKSNVGLDATETSRSVAFCAHAILNDAILEVSDACEDPRFADNPLVTDAPHIRFYAGAPLLTPNGYALGTLCTIDQKPKILSDHQKQALATLGKAVIAHLEVRKKNEELEKTNQFKSDFLSYVSHEVRTPLNGINTLSRLLEEEARQKQLPATFCESLNHIRTSGERLLDIVNTVLDVKQIEAGKMKAVPRAVALRDFFTHLFSLVRIRAEDQGVRFSAIFSPTLPEVVNLDDTKFSQVALNILTNAVKYTSVGKAVECQINYQDGQLLLLVKDEGIGMTPEEVNLLFTPFMRTKKAQQFEGTGLGLTITKSLLDVLDGHIRVTSAVNQGTNVRISVPCQSVSTQSLANQQAPVLKNTLQFGNDVRILVVEDNDINQVVIRAVFDALEHDVDIVASGEEAVDYVQKVAVDLILMDLNLPGISGIEATRRIKKQFPFIPVVALTADLIADKTQLHADGIDSMLTKPVENLELIRILNFYLGSQAQEE